MWSKTIVFIAISCIIWAYTAQAYPQNQEQNQSQGPCGPPPSGPPPSGAPPNGMPPRNGKGPCGPPPNGAQPTGIPPAATTASSG